MIELGPDVGSFKNAKQSPQVMVADQVSGGINKICVNAMSTRMRRFWAVNAGESGLMLAVVGKEKSRNQRLILQPVEIPSLSESPRSWLIT